MVIGQLFFLREELNNIVAAKLVLKHYKHSDPTEPIELLIYREHPVCQNGSVTIGFEAIAFRVRKL